MRDVHYRRLVLYRLPLFLPITSLISSSAAEEHLRKRLAIGEPNAPPPTPISQPDQCLSSSQTKPPVLLGSSNFISEHDIISETVENISVFGHVLVDCFEIESAPSGLTPIVKGRLRAHYNFWSQNLKANTFILRVTDKGCAIPFIRVPPKVYLYNNTSALTHADIVWEAVQDLLISGSIIEVPSPPHVVLTLHQSLFRILSGKKRLILDLRHVNKHIWKEKFKFEDIRNASIYLPTDNFV